MLLESRDVGEKSLEERFLKSKRLHMQPLPKSILTELCGMRTRTGHLPLPWLQCHWAIYILIKGSLWFFRNKNDICKFHSYLLKIEAFISDQKLLNKILPMLIKYLFGFFQDCYQSVLQNITFLQLFLNFRKPGFVHYLCFYDNYFYNATFLNLLRLCRHYCFISSVC